MRPYYLLYAVLFAFGMSSCKQDNAAVQEVATQVAPDETAKNNPQQAANEPGDVDMSSGHEYTFLTDKLFHYKAAFGGAEGAEQPYKDEWIDLDADGTFKAGKLKQQTHTGKWSYNHDTRILFLRPDVRNYKMSEWKVMFNDQMMVWVGTSTYGDNNTQIKLVRSSELP